MHIHGFDCKLSETIWKSVQGGYQVLVGFKESILSEGHSTGIPTIRDELDNNGSHRVEFFIDED